LFLPCEPVQITSKNKKDKDKCLADLTKSGYKKKLKETLRYIGEATLVTVFNSERKMLEHYGEKSLAKESHIEQI
jgi:hypothetical protein